MKQRYRYICQFFSYTASFIVFGGIFFQAFAPSPARAFTFIDLINDGVQTKVQQAFSLGALAQDFNCTINNWLGINGSLSVCGGGFVTSATFATSTLAQRNEQAAIAHVYNVSGTNTSGTSGSLYANGGGVLPTPGFIAPTYIPTPKQVSAVVAFPNPSAPKQTLASQSVSVPAPASGGSSQNTSRPGSTNSLVTTDELTSAINSVRDFVSGQVDHLGQSIGHTISSGGGGSGANALTNVDLGAGYINNVLPVLHGGTGTSTLPTYGQILVGNSLSGYDLVATSSLGIPTFASTTDWNNAFLYRLVSASAPLTLSNNALSISQASSTANGYLSFTDWSTFNGKQASGNYITALTGDVTASGPVGGGSAASTIANGAVSLSKMANLAANTLIGNSTGSSATPTALSTSSVRTMLGLLLNGTLTTGGNFTTSGAGPLTLTTTGPTNVTLPTSGTLATLAGAESLTNKTSIGVGTSTPWGQLSVNPNGITGPAFVVGSSTGTNFIVANSGNVGVGTTDPGAKFTIAADADLTDSSNAPLRITGLTNPNKRLSIGYDTVNDAAVLQSVEAGVVVKPLLINPSHGNVGIGTTNPQYQLDVNGTIGNSNGGISLESTNGGGLTFNSHNFNNNSFQALTIPQNGGIEVQGSVNNCEGCDVLNINQNGDTYITSLDPGGSGNTTNTLSLAGGGYFNLNSTVDSSNSSQSTFAVTPAGLNVNNDSSFNGNPQAVSVSGHYTYLPTDSGYLTVYDTSVPGNGLSGIANLQISSGDTMSGIAIAGNYAYVVSPTSPNLYKIDISNPANPSVVQDAGNNIVANASAVAVSGHYAYVTSSNGDGISVFDTNNISSGPISSWNDNSDSLSAIVIRGKYAYVASTGGNSFAGMYVIDISNPLSLSTVSTYDTGFGGNSIAVSQNYAYILDTSNHVLSRVNIADPGNLSLAGSYNTDSGPSHVFVSGNYVYVSAQGASTIDVFKDNSGSGLTQVQTITSLDNAAIATFAAGKYLYVAEPGGPELQVFDMGGFETPSALVHSLQAGQLQVTDNAIIQGNLDVNTGLNVGTGGINSTGSLAFVGSLTGTNFIVTNSGNVGIGTEAPLKTLDVRGDSVFYASGGNFSEGLNIFKTGEPGAGEGLNLHDGLAGTPMSAATLSGYVRLTGSGTHDDVKIGTYDGTTDHEAIRIKNSNGNVGISTSSPSEVLSVAGNGLFSGSLTSFATNTFRGTTIVGSVNPTALPNAPFQIGGNVNSYLQSTIQNSSTGGSASSDYVATSDNGTDSTYYVDFGINNSGYNDPAFTISGANEGYLYSQSTSLAIGTASSSANTAIKFFTGGTLAANERARITNNGFFGLGSTTPWGQLSVNPNGITGPAFVVGSSTKTSFLVTNTGFVAINATTTDDMLAVRGNGTNNLFEAYSSTGTSTFLVQNAGLVGISSSTPFATFAINPTAGVASNQFIVGSSTATNFIITNSGSVGINTLSPQGLLDINNTATTSNGVRIFGNQDLAGGSSLLNVNYNRAGTTGSDIVYFNITSGSGTSALRVNQLGTGNVIKLQNNSTDVFTIPNSGFVGISSSTPWGLLSVNPNGITGPAFVVGSSTKTSFIVTQQGNVAVGTTTTLGLFNILGTTASSTTYLEQDSNDTSSAILSLRKSRGTGAVAANDFLGQIDFSAYTGSQNLPGASIYSIANIIQSNAVYSSLVFATRDTSNGAMTQRMLINNAGNVTFNAPAQGATQNTVPVILNGSDTGSSIGFATTTTLAILNTAVNANNYAGIGFYQSQVGPAGNLEGYIGLQHTTNGASYSGDLVFGTKAANASTAITEYMRIATGGNVGVGSTTPWGQLSVNPNGITGPAFVVGSSTLTSFTVANSGNVGIGTTSPMTRFAVSATTTFDTSVANLISTTNAPIQIASTTSGFTNAGDIAVSGKYAYITTRSGTGNLAIFDVSTPNTPRLIGSTTLSGVNGPLGISVSGNYAYISVRDSAGFAIVDITNPTSPTVASTISVTDSGGPFSKPIISGRYAYVVTHSGTNKVYVIDIASSTAPVIVGSVSVGQSVLQYILRQKYIFTANRDSNTMSVVDISNPSSPTVSATYTFPVSFGPTSLNGNAQGKYFYAFNNSGNLLNVIDISNPTTPTSVGTFTIGTGGITGTALAGRYLYAEQNSKDIIAIDISNPTAPYLAGKYSGPAGQFNNNAGIGMTTSGRYLYLNSGYGLQVFDLNGVETSSLLAHSSEVGTESVLGDLTVGGIANINTSLNVGFGGFMTQGSAAIQGSGYFGGKVGIASTTPWAQFSINPNALTGPSFAIGSSTATNFVVTQQGNVGIGTSNPAYTLVVNGTTTVATELRVNTNAPLLGGLAYPFSVYRNGSGGDGAAMTFRREGDQITGSIYNTGSAAAASTCIDPYFNYTSVSNALCLSASSASVTALNLGNGNGTVSNTLTISNSNAANTTVPIRIQNMGSSVNSNTTFAFGSITQNSGIVGDVASIVGVKLNNSALNGSAVLLAGALAFNTTNNALSSTERMRIDYNGNVGIGSTSPATLFAVAGTSTLQALLPSGPFTGNMSAYNIGSSSARWNAMWAGTYNVGTSTWSLSATGADRFGIFNAPSAGGTESLSILQTSGNIGIGTTTPGARLTVQGPDTSSATNAFSVTNSTGTSLIAIADNGAATLGGAFTANSVNAGNTVKSTGTLSNTIISGTCIVQTNAAALASYSSAATAPTTGDIFYNSTRGKHSRITTVTSCVDGSSVTHYILTLTDSITGSVSGDSYTTYTPSGNLGDTAGGFFNNIYAVNVNALASTLTGGFDVAEEYQTHDASVEAGDIIRTDTTDTVSGPHVSKTSTAYDSSVIGVVSTNPGLTLGNETDTVNGVWRKVALVGRVPVKVSLENGAIIAGDFLTPSSQPGIAMKATQSGQVIGTALEAYTGPTPENKGKVLVFVKTGFQFIANDAGITLLDTASSTVTSSTSFSPFITSIARSVLSFIQVNGEFVIAKISATVGAFSTKVATPRVETQTAAVSNGLEMTDSVTGQVYCIRITNGDWNKVPGSCANAGSTSAASSTAPVSPVGPLVPQNTQQIPTIPLPGESTSTPVTLPASTASTSSSVGSSTDSSASSTPSVPATPVPLVVSTDTSTSTASTTGQ